MLADLNVALRFHLQPSGFESLSAGFYHGLLPPRFAAQGTASGITGSLRASSLSGAILYATSRRTFRPGTAFMCCALTTSTSKWPSSTLSIGFQNTPVLSIAHDMRNEFAEMFQPALRVAR